MAFTNDEQDPKEDDNNMLENMVKALHMELLFVHQRVAVKHAALGQGKSGLCIFENMWKYQ